MIIRNMTKEEFEGYVALTLSTVHHEFDEDMKCTFWSNKHGTTAIWIDRLKIGLIPNDKEKAVDPSEWISTFILRQ